MKRKLTLCTFALSGILIGFICLTISNNPSKAVEPGVLGLWRFFEGNEAEGGGSKDGCDLTLTVDKKEVCVGETFMATANVDLGKNDGQTSDGCKIEFSSDGNVSFDSESEPLKNGSVRTLVTVKEAPKGEKVEITADASDCNCGTEEVDVEVQIIELTLFTANRKKAECVGEKNFVIAKLTNGGEPVKGCELKWSSSRESAFVGNKRSSVTGNFGQNYMSFEAKRTGIFYVTVSAGEDCGCGITKRIELVGVKLKDFQPPECLTLNEKGEVNLKREDIEIETKPSGHGKTIETNPLLPWTYSETGEKKITAECGDLEVQETIKVFPKNEILDQKKVPISGLNITSIIGGGIVETFKKATKSVDEISDKAKGVSPCNFVSPELKFNFKSIQGKRCCYNEIDYVKKLGGDFNHDLIGFDCAFPFSGVSGVAAANVTAGAKASLLAETSSIQECGDEDVCVPLKLSLEASGGVSVTALGGDAASAKGDIVGTWDDMKIAKVCMKEKLEPVENELSSQCLDVDLRFTVKFIDQSITNPRVDITEICPFK